MRLLVSRVLALIALACSANAYAQDTSISFGGNAIPDQDRVTIRIDPHVPADVGLDFTIEFWMKAVASQNPSGSNGTSTCNPNSSENWITGRIIIDRAIFNHDRHGDYGLAIFRSGNTAALAFGILKLVPNRQGLGLCGNIDVGDNQWHHVAITRNASSGQIRIWVDGEMDVQGTGPSGDISYEDGVPSSADPGNLQRDNYLGFGAEKFDASAVEYPSYRGLMDDVRISNVVRYTQPFTRPTQPHPANANTVALYRFDEPSGTTIVDSAPGGGSPGVLRPPATRVGDTPFGAQPPVDSLQFSMAADSVNESAGSKTVTVTRPSPTAVAASVQFRLAVDDGTATSGADYDLPASNTLNWASSNGDPKQFIVTILEDQQPESPPETINLELFNATGAAMGAQGTFVLSLIDNDVTQPGSFRFTNAPYAAAENAGSSTISVERINGSDGSVSVGFQTANGTASAGSDYTSNSGTLSWGDGLGGIQTFDVAITNDVASEANETVMISLSNPTGGAALGNPSSATLTIADDETPQAGSVRFTVATFSVAEHGGGATISAERVNGTSGDVSVEIATTASGNATAGTDYTAASDTLDWGDGEAGTRSFTVTVLDDSADEQAETVSLALSMPMGGVTVGNPSAATLTITDNDNAPAPPPPAPSSDGGGGSFGVVALFVLLLELARRRANTLPAPGNYA